MRTESLVAIKSSRANRIDMAAYLPCAIRPALPGPTRGASRKVATRLAAARHKNKSRVICHPTGVELRHLRLLRCRCAVTGLSAGGSLKPFRGPLAAK